MIEDWKPRPKTKRIPYGYVEDSQNPKQMIPEIGAVTLMEEVLDQLDAGISFREAADYFTSKSGFKMSHMGIRLIQQKMRPNRVVKQVHPKPTKERMTHAERSAYRKRMKLTNEKKSLAAIKKRIAKAQAEIEGTKAKEDLEIRLLTAPVVTTIEYEASDVPPDRDVVFTPHPGPQTEFLASSEQEVLYGGAAGGGKSFAMLADPMRYFDNPRFNGLLLRRTNDELRKLITESQFLYKKAFPGASWKEQKNLWVFPSGAQFWMTYLERDEDVQRYQGQEFSWIGVDELTQYATPRSWIYLSSRLRVSEDSGLPTIMRATTNPGGPGHGWVKRMFIDPAPPNVAFDAQDFESGEVMRVDYGDKDFPEEMWGQPLFQRKFIPAKLSDNPSLGWRYKANLLSQTESVKRQLLDGDWTVADGAAFSEFRTHIHTCRPFDIPRDWLKFRSCDFGYSERQASAVHWYVVDPTFGTIYVYRELYVNKLTGTQLALRVRDLELGERISYGVLDSSVWAIRGQTGPTIAEEMQRVNVPGWRRSDRTAGARIASKNRLHELLRIDEISQKPGIIFFDTCRRIIGDLPVIPSSKEDDDIDRKYANDHAYDSIRYGIQTRPRGEAGWDSWGSHQDSYRPADATFGY